ncbi:MAG TPA: hypothetical protein VFT43_14165 [Candidatus Polarisedimenticolia bacterium]|nr:hypothetical protein [Candidatus Polarisedimenticolia bacterium]
MPSPRLRNGTRTRGLVLAISFTLAGLLAGSCARRSDDPGLSMLRETLRPGERVLLSRVLDPETGDRIAVVVVPAGGRPELRVYERHGSRGFALAFTAQQGDRFQNLDLEDVDADGRDEILATWEGGHLETLEVIARGEDGSYRTLFQNAGRQIERRYGPTGALEFWITSRTYEETPGQPAAYDTTVYRWDGAKFAEARR